MVTAVKLKEIYKGGYIFTLRKGTKDFTSAVSGESIAKGTQYYSVTRGGGGLGWLKFPDRINLNEIDAYLTK
jgi:hypothetical protein